jgi:hypothetical protein
MVLKDSATAPSKFPLSRKGETVETGPAAALVQIQLGCGRSTLCELSKDGGGEE